MADLTLEILTNKEKYPDTAEITLADGQKLTVKQFRDALQPRAEFTRASEVWSKKQKELEGAVDGLQKQLAQALEEKKAAPPDTRVPADAGRITEEELLADPILGPLYTRLTSATKTLEAHETRLKTHEDTWLKAGFESQLRTIAARHTLRFNKDGKGKAFDQKAFLDYAIQRGVSDLEVAYEAFSRPDEIALTEQEAEARGIEKGKTQARVPVVPFGRRRAPVRPEGLPATLQELDDDKVLADPEMQQAMQGTPE